MMTPLVFRELLVFIGYAAGIFVAKSHRLDWQCVAGIGLMAIAGSIAGKPPKWSKEGL